MKPAQDRLRSDFFAIQFLFGRALENTNLEIGVLPESSVVKTHKLFTIHQSKIIRKFSLVKIEYFEIIADKIKTLIKPIN